MEDKRFTKNIDQHGAGLTKLMSEAIKIFVDNQKSKGDNNETNYRKHN